MKHVQHMVTASWRLDLLVRLVSGSVWVPGDPAIQAGHPSACSTCLLFQSSSFTWLQLAPVHDVAPSSTPTPDPRARRARASRARHEFGMGADAPLLFLG